MQISGEKVSLFEMLNSILNLLNLFTIYVNTETLYTGILCR